MISLHELREQIAGIFVPKPVSEVSRAISAGSFWIKAGIVVVGLIAVAAIVDDVTDLME